MGLSRKIQTQTGDRRGLRTKNFRDTKERACANPMDQYHSAGVHEKLVKFPLMVLLVSTVEFPPTRCVTQFCRICRDESLFSRST